MKRLLIVLLAALILTATILSFMIPRQLQISTTASVLSNANAVRRVLSDTAGWKNWWAKQTVNTGDHSLQFGYKLAHVYQNGAEILIQQNGDESKSNITLVPLTGDSCLLIWKCSLSSTSNPIRKISNYTTAKTIKKEMEEAVGSLNKWVQKKKNVYGFTFSVTMSRDSTLIMTKSQTGFYPSPIYIDSLIRYLKKYAADMGAREANYPMLNIKKTEEKFETMVAIPVDRELPGNGKVFFSRFVPWKVLMAEVTGGTKSVENALAQMDLYLAEHQITKMAVPFQSLVTDRIAEPDSNKWITRIYTPIP